MSNATYKQDLHDIAIAVANNCKNYIDKRISDLEWELGTYDLGVDSDTTSAYQKVVPVNSIEAKVNTLGGMSYKVNQLIANGNFATNTDWGVFNSNYATLTINDNKATVTIKNYTSGVSSYNMGLKQELASETIIGHKYLLMFKAYSETISTIALDSFGGYRSFGITLNQWNNINYIINESQVNGSILIVPTSNQADNNNFQVEDVQIFNLTADFGSGNEPSTVSDCATEYAKRGIDIYSYIPQQSGIRDTAITSVKSVGFNMFDGDIKDDYSISSIDGTDVLTPNSTCSKNYIELNTNTTYYCKSLSYLNARWYDSNKTYLGYSIIQANSTFTPSSAFTNAKYLRFNLTTTYNNDICINISNASLNGTYKPYFTASLLIPAQVQALDGYGWGVNDTCYNYIDFNVKKFIKKANKYTFTGNESWSSRGSGTGGDLYYLILSEIDSAKSDFASATLLSNGYYVDGGAYDGSVSGTIGLDNKTCYICIPSGANPNTIFASGVVMLYELATPVETDISAYLTTNKITVEGGGTLTAENTYGASVPSDIDYLKEVAK